jgi:hypothetical protein
MKCVSCLSYNFRVCGIIIFLQMSIDAIEALRELYMLEMFNASIQDLGRKCSWKDCQQTLFVNVAASYGFSQSSGVWMDVWGHRGPIERSAPQ